MIRALIVDDEKMTRNGLVRHIKWEQLGWMKYKQRHRPMRRCKCWIHFTPTWLFPIFVCLA